MSQISHDNRGPVFVLIFRVLEQGTWEWPSIILLLGPTAVYSTMLTTTSLGYNSRKCYAT
jgi:hypothetical protein